MLFNRKIHEHQSSDQALNETAEGATCDKHPEHESSLMRDVKHCKNKQCNAELPSTSTSDYCEDCRRGLLGEKVKLVAAIGTLLIGGMRYAKPILSNGNKLFKRFL